MARFYRTPLPLHVLALLVSGVALLFANEARGQETTAAFSQEVTVPGDTAAPRSVLLNVSYSLDEALPKRWVSRPASVPGVLHGKIRLGEEDADVAGMSRRTTLYVVGGAVAAGLITTAAVLLTGGGDDDGGGGDGGLADPPGRP